MTREFVPEGIAIALREIGFDERCMSADWYADGKICIEYPEEGVTNTEHDKLTKECNDDAAETGEDKIEDGATVPLYQQAFRWFREKYKLNSSILLVANGYGFYVHKDRNYTNNGESYGVYITYKEAEQACLDKLIKICKTKTNEQID
jgi:hypothetical protein